MKGMLLIISGPSGSGKGTVVRKLCENDRYSLSVSVTTRARRMGEVHGVDYFFCGADEFRAMLSRGELLESAQFVGNYYATPRLYVEEQIEKGRVVILEIEVNGALQIKEKMPDAVLVFMLPQTAAELKRRLMLRATEDEDTIERRLRRADEEIGLIDKYDYIVVNDMVENAVSAIDAIVNAELSKPSRNIGLIAKFKEDSAYVKTVLQ